MIYKREVRLYYYLDPVNEKGKMFGPNLKMTGRFGGVSGDCTNVCGDFVKRLVGDVSNMFGDATGKTGSIHPILCGNWTRIKDNITNLRGDVSGLSGNVSRLTFVDCAGWIGDCSDYFGHVDRILTDEEKKRGVKLEDYANGLL